MFHGGVCIRTDLKLSYLLVYWTVIMLDVVLWMNSYFSSLVCVLVVYFWGVYRRDRKVIPGHVRRRHRILYSYNVQ